MKKLLELVMCITAFATVLMFPSTVNAASKNELIQKIEENISREIIKTYYDDFDGDGTKEMFAIVGENEIDAFSIWFASDKTVKEVKDDNGMYVYPIEKGNGICKVSSKQKIFIAETGLHGTTSFSICFYVKNGMPIEVKKSGERITQKSGKDFLVHPTDFDWASDGSGHTWKAYYIKWTGTKFTEYTANKISETKLKKYSGSTSVLKNIKKAGYSVRSIYLRKNKTIQINVRKKRIGSKLYENENVTLIIKGNKVTAPIINKNASNYVTKRSYGGIYKASGF